jgi:DNA-binding NtrC family response regulator
VTRVLIVDDELPIRRALKRILTAMDCQVTDAENGVDAQARLAETEFDLVITDLSMLHADGFVVLRAARELTPAPPVVVLTGHGTAADCVRAMRAGAIDFMSKPFHPNELRQVVARALQSRTRTAPGTERQPDGPESSQAVLIGDSPELRGMLDQIGRLAETDETALLVGERHTGKEAIARLLHAVSPHAGGPLIVVDCGASAPEALQTELFSASANGPGKVSLAEAGTLVLTGLERVDPALRARVLSALSDCTRGRDGGRTPVDVRLVIDIERTPENESDAQAIAAAAQQVLGGVVIQVPSIRERRDDVPQLIEHFVEVASRRLDRRVNPQTLLAALGGYAWPGNLKELETRVARFVTAAPPEITDEPAPAPNALVVPVDRFAVTLVLHDGSRHDALLPRGSGLRVDSLFESKEPFVPVREHGTTQIYARTALASIGVRGGEKRDEEDGLPRRNRAVRVHLLSGVVLEGELRYVLVEGRGRVTDVLNEASASFTLYENDLVHYVAKAHVARVEER